MKSRQKTSYKTKSPYNTGVFFLNMLNISAIFVYIGDAYAKQKNCCKSKMNKLG